MWLRLKALRHFDEIRPFLCDNHIAPRSNSATMALSSSRSLADRRACGLSNSSRRGKS